MTKRHTSSGDCFGNCAAFEAYDILEVRGEGLASWAKEDQRDKTYVTCGSSDQFKMPSICRVEERADDK